MVTVSNGGNEFFTTQEACTLLKISMGTLRKLLGNKLTTYRVGKRILIARKDLEDFLNKGR